MACKLSAPTRGTAKAAPSFTGQSGHRRLVRPGDQGFPDIRRAVDAHPDHPRRNPSWLGLSCPRKTNIVLCPGANCIWGGSLREKYDTVIIGGGQAGLAMSYHLRQRGREHIILERRRVAERWRTERWDSLRFQLPNSWLELPGKPYAGTDPNGFTHYSDVVRFIVDYAAEIAAPVRTGVEVTSLSPDEGGGYSLETTDGQINARHVVIATGPFQRPMIPDYSRAVPSSVYQTDATHYRNPAELPPGAVLIVGTGNSGCQIADELLRSGRRVFLAISRHSRAPRRYRGKDVIWWYENLGRFDVNIDTFPGRRYPPTINHDGRRWWLRSRSPSPGQRGRQFVRARAGHKRWNTGACRRRRTTARSRRPKLRRLH